ncbi:MAG: hypothetical protein O7E52_19050 [Candidatus Poribacteria bacterium]|nr:hypothetical protein [Candidatus Poribacteria bacterium]
MAPLSRTWSPDGTKIALTAARDGNHEIYIMDANGTRPRRLTEHPANNSEPHWSPFVAEAPAAAADISISMRPDRLIAGSGATAKVIITVIDVLGNFLTGETISLTATNGVLPETATELGKVIIVLDGGNSQDNPAWDTFNGLAEYVHNVFRGRTFDEEDIQFLSPEPTRTVGADTETTVSTLELAITNWAKSRVNPQVPLFLYLLSHNLEDQFLLEKRGDREIFLAPGACWGTIWSGGRCAERRCQRRWERGLWWTSSLSARISVKPP